MAKVQSWCTQMFHSENKGSHLSFRISFTIKNKNKNKFYCNKFKNKSFMLKQNEYNTQDVYFKIPANMKTLLLLPNAVRRSHKTKWRNAHKEHSIHGLSYPMNDCLLLKNVVTHALCFHSSSRRAREKGHSLRNKKEEKSLIPASIVIFLQLLKLRLCYTEMILV